MMAGFAIWQSEIFLRYALGSFGSEALSASQIQITRAQGTLLTTISNLCSSKKA